MTQSEKEQVRFRKRFTSTPRQMAQRRTAKVEIWEPPLRPFFLGPPNAVETKPDSQA